MIVYLATNTVNGMQYVGAALDFEKRKGQHILAGRRNKGSRGSLSAALGAFGEDAFKFEIVDRADNLWQLAQREAQWMLKLNTLAPNGYNLITGGYHPHQRKSTVIKVGDVIYPSFAEAVRQLKPMPIPDAAGGHPKNRPIGDKGVKERINCGWTVEQAFGLEEAPRYRENVKYCQRVNKNWKVAGMTFKSLKHLSEHYDIPLYRLKSRIQRGWTLNEAVEITPRKSYNGINKTSRGKRTERKRPVHVQGQFFDSRTEAAKHFGIDPKTFTARLKNGWPPEQAAGLEPRPKQALGEYKFGMKVKPVTCFGKKFPSTNQAALYFSEKNNIPHGTIIDRVMRGWNLERAMSQPSGKTNSGDYWRSRRFPALG